METKNFRLLGRHRSRYTKGGSQHRALKSVKWTQVKEINVIVTKVRSEEIVVHGNFFRRISLAVDVRILKTSYLKSVTS